MRRVFTRETMIMAAVATLAVYALTLLSPAIFNDSDTFWHIRAGQWMIAHHMVLDHDIFSLPFAGRSWDTQEWLSEILMAFAFQLSGWSGVAILTALAIAATAAQLALYLSRHLDPVPCIVVLALALSCVMPDLLARPHILVLPVLTLWVAGLAEAAESQRAPRWILLPVMTLATNLHGSFIVGLALILPFAVDGVLTAKERQARLAMQWCLFAAGSAAAALLNPRGLGGLLFPFALMKTQSLAAVGEWQGLDLGTFNSVELAAAAALFFLIWRGVRMSAVRIVVLFALLHLSILHARYGMFLGIVGAILIAQPLGAVLPRSPAASMPVSDWRLAVAGFTILLLACGTLRIAWPVQRGESPIAPVSAFAAVPPSLAAQPVFNDYSFGGFLIWKGVRPMVDSRADFYGDVWLQEYARTVGGDLNTTDRIFRKYRVAWTFLKSSDPLVAELDRRPGWRRLYADGYAVVQAGPGVTSRPIALGTRAEARESTAIPPSRHAQPAGNLPKAAEITR
jgi:hypothetical protein